MVTGKNFQNAKMKQTLQLQTRKNQNFSGLSNSWPAKNNRWTTRASKVHIKPKNLNLLIRLNNKLWSHNQPKITMIITMILDKTYIKRNQKFLIGIRRLQSIAEKVIWWVHKSKTGSLGRRKIYKVLSKRLCLILLVSILKVPFFFDFLIK